MPLFDESDRTHKRGRREAEPLFDYYNSSARPGVIALRRLLEEWFERFPPECKTDVRARFRSTNDSHHQGAFWEIYLHELMFAMGFTVRCHPPSGDGTETHPDFVVSHDGNPRFFLEATIVTSSQDQLAEERRIAQVYDALNAANSPNFFLGIRSRGGPATPPAGARLRGEIEKWLTTLDPDAVVRNSEGQEGLDGFPQLDWTHDGWDITILALPKSLNLRGQPGVRPIGVTIPEMVIVESHKAVRASVSKKATRYGALSLPYIVAVNVIDEHAHFPELLNGLLGEECVVATRYADGVIRHEDARNPNGAWIGPHGPRNTRVSAVLGAFCLSPWTVAVDTPQLVHNPWAARPMDPIMWPLSQWVANGTGLRQRTGQSGQDILAIPAPWPVPDEERQ